MTIAQSLNEELKLQTTFICSNVLDLPNHLEKKFDIVFTSYGVVCWLDDLNKWAKVINHFLKPEGLFYIIEFHPSLTTFNFEDEVFFKSYFKKMKPDFGLEQGT